jgi:ornithine cyclodeaminase/alanine dehydrogenase-like protein (mu-crystallin family)
MNRNLLYLSRDNVRKILTVEEAMPAVRKAFIQLSQGEVDVPQRMHLDLPQFEGVELIKPVYSPGSKRVAIKVISLFKNNVLKKLPHSHALLMLLDAETGIPLAVMDADYLTAVRTGAASGLATDLLANKSACNLALIGSGPQAATQAKAVLAVRPLTKIHIYDPSKEKAHKLANNLSSRYGVEISVASAVGSLHESDIICTATTSAVPVFSDHQIPEGVHINGIGSFKPDTSEIPAETVKRSLLFVDQREACLKEAGDIVIPLKQGIINELHILAEIGEVAAGSKQGRKSEKDITFFKSVGNAVQDLAMANLVYGKAMKNKIGQILEL